MNPKGDDRHFPLGDRLRQRRLAMLVESSPRTGRPYRAAPSKGARSRMMGELMSPDTPKSGGVISDGLVEYPRSAEPLACFRPRSVPGSDHSVHLLFDSLKIIQGVARQGLRLGCGTHHRMLAERAQLVFFGRLFGRFQERGLIVFKVKNAGLGFYLFGQRVNLDGAVSFCPINPKFAGR